MSSYTIDFYGLPIYDLTEEQLKKVDINKLISCVYDDPRVIKIIADKLDPDNLHYLSDITSYKREEEVAKTMKLPDFDYLLVKYNEIVKLNPDLNVYNRSSYFIWSFLNEENRKTEELRFIECKRSVASKDRIDINLLYIYYTDEQRDQIINKAICDFGGNYYNNYKNNILPLIISSMSVEILNKYVDTMYSHFNNDNKFILLSNPNLSDRHTEKILRLIAGRLEVPSVKVYLSKKVLNKLPPVMRLDALETLVRNVEVEFTDIKSAEELKELLFCTSMKYNARVSRVLSKLDKFFPENITQGVNDEHIS